jgi:two-component system CheB/CheR fusion protein
LLVTLREERSRPPDAESPEAINMGVVSRDRISTLEHDLRTSRENLQATIEELETSNEELQATNEELIASNEELQSTNEELHSVNEELYTVNAEYQRKIVELTEMTDDLENLLQSTSLAVLFLDEELRIRKFTSPVSQLFNILKQDVGRPFENFSHNIEFPELGERVRDVLQSQTAYECEVRDRAGSCHLLRIMPYRSSAQAAGVIVLLIDVQSLKAAEAELRRKERELQAILDNFPALMFVKDLGGRYVLLNKQARQVFRLSADEAQGRTAHELLPAAAAEQVDRQDQQVLTTGLTVQTELTLRLQGRTRTYLSIKYPLRDDTGRVINVAGFWVDITKQKKAEQQARQAAEQRDRFLAMLSHELRNPLAAVQNSGYLLQQLQLTADAAEAVQIVVRQCRHMARLLDDLLDVSRISQGKLVLHKELIDLRQPAADAVQNVEQQALVRRITLERHLPAEPLVVEGDADRLQQVQANLLVNAIKYTPTGGKVEFSVERLDGHALISVSDTGVGMSKQLQRRVFDLFVQGNETLDRADGGMGVGLTLVRSIVDLHGGEVNAASDGPGEGSQFTVKLPLSQQPLPGGPAAPLVSARDGAGLSILLVEDNADARNILAKLLETYDYRVQTAADGFAALECLQQALPDVALVDIGLPRLSGYQVAKQVRERWPDRRPYLVALTGYGRTQDRERALEAGFDEHLTKPVHIQRLRSLLARALPAVAQKS